MKKLRIFIFAFILFLISHSLLLIVHLFASRFIGKDCICQWYQINLPVSGSVFQMQFINSSTGWATVKQSNINYYLLRTTDSGTNWTVIYNDSAKVENIQFINDSLGYALGQGQGTRLLLKTTNKGYNWTIMQNSSSYVFGGFYMINADTGWVNAFSFKNDSRGYYTFRTTNGFQTLEQITIGGGGTPATLYFFKEKYNGEYYGYMLGGGNFWKTTNSGNNWQLLYFSESGNVNSFSFINRDTGWVVYYPTLGNISKILYSLNAGQNWIQQYQSTIQNDYGYIQAKNKNKIWCGTSYNSKILVTTNSGLDWGNQSSQIYNNKGIYMFDTLLGFSWNSSQVARTTNGGGPITSIAKISSIIPSIFELKQNYPNPFNSSTAIEFDVPKNAVISLILYDILGREIMKIIDTKEIIPGSYKTLIDLNNYNLSGGIYLYKIIVSNTKKYNVFSETKRMVFVK